MILKNLVLSGGQIKGLCYAGVIKAMEDMDLMSNLENILGVSSGAIFAFGIAIGLSGDQIIRILEYLTLDNLRDINTENILIFDETLGIDTCNKFCRLFKIICKKIVGKSDATFSDLKQKNPKYNLMIAGANITHKRLDIFSHENTPDMPVWLAIRISMTVPIYFTKVCYNDSYYVDGGVIDNYPIYIFDEDIENTLGIMLTDPSTEKNLDNIGQYMYRIMDCLLARMSDYLKEKYKNNTIDIFVKYDVIELRFDDAIKKFLFEIGYNQFKNAYISMFKDISDTTSVSTNTESIAEDNIDDVIDSLKNDIISNHTNE